MMIKDFVGTWLYWTFTSPKMNTFRQCLAIVYTLSRLSKLIVSKLKLGRSQLELSPETRIYMSNFWNSIVNILEKLKYTHRFWNWSRGCGWSSGVQIIVFFRTLPTQPLTRFLFNMLVGIYQFAIQAPNLRFVPQKKWKLWLSVKWVSL